MTHLFPVVAHTAGAGSPPTYWVSDVTLHNPNESSIEVGFAFFPFDQENSFEGVFPVTLTIQPHYTVLVEDVLGTLFAANGNSKGFLLVSSDAYYLPSNPQESGFIATSRTYNTGSPEGTYGQTVNGTMLYWNGSSTHSMITGIRNGGHYRCNLGVLNLSMEPIQLHWQIRGPTGTVFMYGAFHLSALEGRQVSLTNDLLIGQADPGTMELWLDTSDVTPDPCNAESVNYFAAYISKVDGNPDGTGDAEFLWAVPDDIPPVGFDCPE